MMIHGATYSGERNGSTWPGFPHSTTSTPSSGARSNLLGNICRTRSTIQPATSAFSSQELLREIWHSTCTRIRTDTRTQRHRSPCRWYVTNTVIICNESTHQVTRLHIRIPWTRKSGR
jgi:hypothetical protein